MKEIKNKNGKITTYYLMKFASDLGYCDGNDVYYNRIRKLLALWHLHGLIEFITPSEYTQTKLIKMTKKGLEFLDKVSMFYEQKS